MLRKWECQVLAARTEKTSCEELMLTHSPRVGSPHRRQSWANVWEGEWEGESWKTMTCSPLAPLHWKCYSKQNEAGAAKQSYSAE